MHVRETYLHVTEEIMSILNMKMSRDQVMKVLKEILANKDMVQKVRDLNF